MIARANGHANGTAPAAKPKPTRVTRVVHAAPGVIRPDEIYTLKEFGQRVGLGRWGIKQLRADGLRVHKTNGRTFVFGKSFFEFLETIGGDSAGD